MPALFKLDVETSPRDRRVSLVLSDGDGVYLAQRDVKLADHPAADWEGLFNTRDHVRRMQSAAEPAAALLAKLGDFLARDVLGPEITGHLAQGDHQRTLLLRLPDVAADPLAAAFARVPWEIARAPGSKKTLLEQNLVIRAVTAGAEPGGVVTVPLGTNELVRVLLVFAEAPGSNPLAMRLERERLLELFFADVLPKHNVEVDVLCHGVTRASIRERVRARGGFHVVHWSGHGHHDLLEIALDEGEKAARTLTGKELVGLFTEAGAGGFVPPVVFLSACHSGSLVSAKSWDALQAALRDGEGPLPAKDVSPVLEKLLEARPGHTGTALELLRAGVKQVVAMRYEVGDTYRRRLARRFYRSLLAEPRHHAVDEALALARTELAVDRGRAGEYHAVDHATPLVFGAEPMRLEPKVKRSAQMSRREPKPQPLLQSGSHDLDPPFGFVGRSEELTLLSRRWLTSGDAPIALIHGLAGLGKTSLAAEAIHLWHTAFDHVLAFQARGGALSLEQFYQRLDKRLALASPVYRARCEDNEMARIYLAPGQPLVGSEREEALRNNLIEALRSEPILLVLDNFETNLRTVEGPDGYASSDPAWDRLFEALADRLRGSGSRVLVTSRHRLAALVGAGRAVRIPLGPLPPRQALLFFQNHRPLRELLYGDARAQRIAKRILDVSRGHPLILGRLADLGNAHRRPDGALTLAGRVVLHEALAKLEAKGFKALPDVFAEGLSDADKDRVRAYLEDVAMGAVDLLLDRQTPEARRLLWTVTRAGEPVVEEMLARVCEEPEKLGGLLETLSGAGLLGREDKAYAFHELVAERATEWMKEHPEERGERTESELWKTYGEWYGAAFKALRDSGKPGVRDLATEFGRRGIRYLVHARAFASLGSFAGWVVTGTNDPAVLGEMIADLRTAAAEAPAGTVRWSLRASLADALWRAGQPDQALPLYEQAIEEAETVEDWSDVGVICNNLAGALGEMGQFERARSTYMQSVAAKRRAGSPRVLIVSSELEALRIDVLRGLAKEALPTVEEKLNEVRALGVRRQQGEDVFEALDGEDLARTLVSGLDVACQANLALERWQAGLELLGEIEQVEIAIGQGKHEIARTRLTQCGPLIRLGQVDKAKVLLEGCLAVFREVGDIPREAMALSTLADVWDNLGDSGQAQTLERQALAVRERLSAPEGRAISHFNLAIYLGKAGSTGEAGEHQLADLIYCLITGLDLRIRLNSLAIDIRNAARRGERYYLPRLTDLLAKPAFAALRTFIAERGVPVEQLQAKVDQLVEQIRAQVSTS